MLDSNHRSSIEASVILEAVAHLVDQSLLLADMRRGTETRFHLLETLRHFAWEKLAEAGEAEIVRGRHRDWYLALVRQAEAGYWTAELPSWLERLDRENDNLRVAMDWCVAEGDMATGLEMAGALWLFWDVRGQLREGRRRLEQLLALDAVGWLTGLQGDLVAGSALMEQGLAIWRVVGDPYRAAWSLARRGGLEMGRQDPETATPLLEEALAAAGTLGDVALEAWARFELAMVALTQGDLPAAKAEATRALTLTRQVQHSWGLAWVLFGLGQIALQEGDLDQAAEHLRESLALRWTLRDLRTLADSVALLACLAGARGQRRRAVRLFGFAQTAREVTGGIPAPARQMLFDQYLAVAQRGLGDSESEVAWSEGRAFSLEAGVRCALDLEDAALSPTEPSAGAPRLSVLTAREREVAALVAQGLSNREIAERLVISERTAENHLSHILDKLGLASRTQVATWAVTHGLVSSMTS